MKKSMLIMAMAVASVFVFMAGSSQASFMGYIYDGYDAGAQNPAIAPAVAISDTFTVDALNFHALTTTTYFNFLSGGVSNPNNVTGLTVLGGNDITTSSGHGTLFVFTGTGYFPANTSITHDDGFWLNLGGTIIDSSAPTVEITTPLNNLAGVYAFTLRYGAWNSYPEILQVRGVTSVPEPGTLLLLGSGLLGLVAVGRNKFRK